LDEVDPAGYRGAAREFLEFCREEAERKRNSGEAFDEVEFNEAVEMVLRRLKVLGEEGRA